MMGRRRDHSAMDFGLACGSVWSCGSGSNDLGTAFQNGSSRVLAACFELPLNGC